MANAVETDRLGKRFRSYWALRECSIGVPEGVVCALIGPNGAGKTTLLQLLAGLSAPSGGTASVFGRVPGQDVQFLADIGFLAQEVPLYRRFTVGDHFAMGAHLNPQWKDSAARERLTALGIPFRRAVGRLSGGQRAQVALAVALSKQPRLLLLDEPVAALDPLARVDFLETVREVNRDRAVTVLMSSHLVSDLERVCDHVVLLAASKVVLCGTVEEALTASGQVGKKSLESLVLSFMSREAGRAPYDSAPEPSITGVHRDNT